ncbi:BrnA antitoxin family protein [Rhodovulum strictum]|uniref:Uncharacterized protein n=1 Tax=Rhodovulum strictum TaxID=58314 RepID=A0A844B188_9RHOB|nr:BrnA antitoxin family protein [Rhodovulum strictum]MRH20136.1 hypothetical protein [Rhodovulum strictum]
MPPCPGNLRRDQRSRGRAASENLLRRAPPVSARLDPVAKFYRANGRGYQALINDVLNAHEQLRLAKVIEGIEDKGPSGEPV